MQNSKHKNRLLFFTGVIGIFFLLHAMIAVPAKAIEYYLPLFIQNSQYATGMALSNTNESSAANVTLIVHDRTGAKVEVGNPQLRIMSDGQFSDVVKTAKDVEGSMIVESDQPLTGLCFLAATGSGADSFMADIPLASEKHATLHVPHIAFNEYWDTILYISNPNGFSVEVRIDVVDSDGKSIASATRTLNFFGSLETPLSELLSGRKLTGGKVKLSASGGVAAFALYHNLKTGARNFAGINAASPSEGQDSSVVGAWGEDLFANEGYGCLVLYEGGKFIDYFSSDGGVEFGTYAVDPDTGNVSKTIIRDDNGVNGLADNGVPYKDRVTIVGDYLIGETLDDIDDPDSKTVLKRVIDEESPIVGAWIIPSSSSDYGALVFYSNGKYFHYGSDCGAEYGTYTHDNATGAMTKSVVYDGNGEYGLADNGTPYNDRVFVTGDTFSLENLDDPDDRVSAQRVR